MYLKALAWWCVVIIAKWIHLKYVNFIITLDIFAAKVLFKCVCVAYFDVTQKSHLVYDIKEQLMKKDIFTILIMEHNGI